MLGLDENLPAGQRELLLERRIRFRVIGADIAPSGTKDENLVPFLHRLPNPTFFSLDRNFYRRDWIHSNYCLVWLEARRREAADFIRRFLKHPMFDTKDKRSGTIIRVHAESIHFWQIEKRVLQTTRWHGE